ncbi:MAG: putative N-acylneuraminate cytidylyltransferase [Acidobacteria bacterium]|nr:putative N-acylneuraminate cytidylyltransferase [Acidobacteriota bacterium]
MVARPEVLAIIQARGGSKGLPGKNLRLLGRHPLVAYSIVSGIAAQTVTRVIISTDDEQIAAVGKQYGAEVPFLRPAEFARDDSPDLPLFEHALDWLNTHESYRPDIVIQLRPTTPLRPRGLIDQAVTALQADAAADCVRGVTIPSQNPYKMWRQSDDGYLLPLMETEFHEAFNMPRQHLPSTLWQTGHIDAIRYETIATKRSLTGDKIRPLLIDANYCFDIDSSRDLELSNWVLSRNNLDLDLPGSFTRNGSYRPWPERIDLVVFDFDGVFTDNRVWIGEAGQESVACNRGDGLGIARLLSAGVDAMVLSTEENPVVTARCKKLGLTCRQGLANKGTALDSLVREKGLEIKNVVYVGNDVNDLDCLRLAGYAVAVADAHREVLAVADLVLQACGGKGAVRELCDLILQRRQDR